MHYGSLWRDIQILTIHGTSHGTLHWRQIDHNGVSNHQSHGCLFRRISKKTSKLRVTGLCVGNSPGPVNSPHKRPVTRKMLPFDDVIMSVAAPLPGLAISWWQSQATRQLHPEYRVPAYTKPLPEPIWFVTNGIMWHSCQGSLCLNTKDVNPRVVFEIYIFKITATSPRRQWVKNCHALGKCVENWFHDDVIKWKHFPRYWPFVRGIHRSPVNSPHKGQWRGVLIFSLICAWING